MELLNSIFDLEGYAHFIVPAYAISALVLLGVLVQSVRFQKRTETELAALQGEVDAPTKEGEGHEAQA